MGTAACRLEAAIDLPVGGIEISADVRTFHRYSMGVSTLAGIAHGDWPEDAPGVSYYQMTELALAALAEREPVGAFYFAASTPDCQVSHFLSQLVAREIRPLPHVLGITDQGIVAPFTALRLARGRIASGAVRRAALLVLEHRMVPAGIDLGRPTVDRAVLLVLGTGTGRPLESVAVVNGREALDGDRRVITSTHRAWPGATVVPPTSGTAAWAELARTESGGPVRIAEHDPFVDYSGEAVFGASD